MMKNFLKYGFITLGVLLLLTGLVWGSGYLWSYRLTDLAEIPGAATLVPEGEVELGRTVQAQAELVLPVRASIEKAVAEAGKGSVLVGTPQVRRGAWRWSTQVWHVTAEVRPFRPGAVEPGALTVELDETSKNKGALLDVIVLPGFTAAPVKVEPGTELQLAGAAELGGKLDASGWYWLLLLIPAAAVIWFVWFRRGRAAGELPPWERALQALHSLRSGLASHEIPVEAGFARLTDLVRGYLEQRFEIPASTRTTPEFLADMDRSASPLPKEQRPFLREFMTAADQVKFAKAPPDDRALNDALAKAEQLVESTRIRPEDEAEGRSK